MTRKDKKRKWEKYVREHTGKKDVKPGTPEGYSAGLGGQKIRSKGMGRGLGKGKGRGPIGIPVGKKKRR